MLSLLVSSVNLELAANQAFPLEGRSCNNLAKHPPQPPHVRGVYKKRSKQGVLCTLDRDVIKNYLEAMREYNEDAFLRPDSGT